MRDPLPVIELANVTVLSDDSTVEWESTGGGPPLVWIEGGPGFPAHLGRPDVDMLSSRFRCYLVNAPGLGRTSRPRSTEDYSLAGHVAFFEAARKAMGLGPVTVAGHSWGGLVAVAWAATQPGSIQRLIVIDGYAGGGSVPEEAAIAEREASFARLADRPWFAGALDDLESVFAVKERTEQELCDEFSPVWPLYFAEPDGVVARHHIERLRRELRWNVEVEALWDARWEADDHRSMAAKVRSTTLLLVGRHDFICGPVWAQALADAIPHARLVVIADAGHFPQYEQPDATLTAIDALLAHDAR